MTRVIECIIGVLLISVMGVHHANQDSAHFILTAEETKREAHKVDGDQLVRLDGLKEGKNYLLHISGPRGERLQIEHSGIRQNRRDRTTPKTSDLPRSLRFEASSSTAWFRLYVSKKTHLHFSLLHRPAKKNGNRAAGINVTPGVSAESLIKDVLIGGNCFDVTGVTPIGPGGGRAQFSNGGGALGISDGVMFTTGNASLFTGPNSSTSTSHGLGGGGDPDLTTIANSSTHDAVGIEFDFTPTVEEVTFRYAFGSEEYCEYTGSDYNDAFGFFLSGPGIGGPYSNGAVNLAKLPTTGDEVSINTINYTDNAGYYVNNAPPSSGGGFGGCVSGEIAAGGEVLNLIEFDGLTIPLEANVQVQACETYHIKLVVADANDGIWDSGVFLQAGSFQAGGEASLEAYNTTDNGEYGFETDCLFNQLVITRQGGGVPLSVPLTVDLIIDPASTATEGVDYEELPDQITIPANQTFKVIPFEIFNDDILEGDESIILKFDFICSCSSPQTEFIIKEIPPLDAELSEQTICEGQVAMIPADASGGYPNPEYEYDWSNGASGESINAYPTDTTQYTVTVTDFCGNTTTSSTTINVTAQPEAQIGGDYLICNGSDEVQIPVNFQGGGPFTLTYSINGDMQPPINNITEDQIFITVDEPGTVTLENLLGTNFCQGEVTGVANIEERNPQIDFTTSDVSCPGTEDGSITINPQDFGDTIDIEWDVSVSDPMNPQNLSGGTYNVTIVDEDGCMASQSIDVTPPPDALNDSIAVLSPITCASDEAEIELIVEYGTPPYTIEWSEDFTDSISPDGLTEGTYYVTVTDSVGCFVTDSVQFESPDVPTISLNNIQEVSCASPEGAIDISVNGGRPPYDINWSSGDTVRVINDLNPGDYTVTITDENECTRTEDFTIPDVSTYPEFEFSTANTLTCAVDSAMLQITNMEFDAESVFLTWSTPDGFISSIAPDSLSAEIDQTGSYVLSVRDTTSGCIWTDTVEVNGDFRRPDPQPVSSNPINCKNSTALIEVVSGIDPSRDVADWYSEDFTLLASDQFTYEVSSSGLYIVEVTDQVSGCVQTDSIVVDENFDQTDALVDPPDTLTCAQPQLTLDGSSSSGQNQVFQWTATQGGSIIGDKNKAVATIASDGMYILEVTDSLSGCSSQDTVEVVNDSDFPDIDVADADPITCQSAQITLDATGSSSGSNFDYTWTTSNGQIESGATTSSPSVSKEGMYVLELTNTDNACTVYDTVEVELDTTAPPASILPPETLTCDVTNIEISLEGVSQQPYFDYEWSTSDGQIISSSDDQSITVDEPGTYSVEILNNQNGCLSSTQISVSENVDKPVADAGSDQLLPCDVNTISLSGSGSGSVDLDFEWTSSDGTIATGAQSQNPGVNATGNYILEVTDVSNGCSSFDTVNVYREIPQSINLRTEPNTCNTTGYMEVNGVSGGNPPYEYSLDGGPFVDNIIYSDLETGSYQLTVRDANGCTVSESFDIESLPGPTLETTPSSFVVKIGQKRELNFETNIADSSIATVQWSPSKYLSCDSCLNPIAQPEENITYTVEVTDEYGCSVSGDLTFRVDKRPDVYIPNAFSPNNDGINDFFTVYSSEAVADVVEMKIFNRWGDKVFRTEHIPANEPQQGWDGRYRGKLMSPAVFIYVIEVELINGETRTFSGDITLTK